MPSLSYETVSAMIAPALFLTATGSLIISTANRIGRIIDRIRVLVELGDRLDRGDHGLDFPDARRAHIDEELAHLQRRSVRTLWAVTLLYLAFACFVGTSLAIGFDSLLGHHLAALPTVFAVCGVTALLGACVNLLLEARAALSSNGLELRFHRELQERRRSRTG